MKLAGHTMGTPEYSLFEAMELFGKMGLDGIEIIVQTDGYPCGIPMDADREQLEAVLKKAEEYGLAISGLTPYQNLFNSLDEQERNRDCAQLKRVIDMAQQLGTKNVRVYGGRLVEGEHDRDGAMFRQLVRSMRECGEYARTHGDIRLNLENHFGTMTTTAHETMRIVEEIRHPNVGILYDQANLAFFPAEEYEEAVDLQERHINYVHCKDLVYQGNAPRHATFSQVTHVDPSERTVRSRIPGQGILDWPSILCLLRNRGYDGWVSLEYERRWIQTDLPEASEGMPIAAAYIRGILDTLKLDEKGEKDR